MPDATTGGAPSTGGGIEIDSIEATRAGDELAGVRDVVRTYGVVVAREDCQGQAVEAEGRWLWKVDGDRTSQTPLPPQTGHAALEEPACSVLKAGHWGQVRAHPHRHPPYGVSNQGRHNARDIRWVS